MIWQWPCKIIVLWMFSHNGSYGATHARRVQWIKVGRAVKMLSRMCVVCCSLVDCASSVCCIQCSSAGVVITLTTGLYDTDVGVARSNKPITNHHSTLHVTLSPSLSLCVCFYAVKSSHGHHCVCLSVSVSCRCWSVLISYTDRHSHQLYFAAVSQSVSQSVRGREGAG